MGLVTEPTTATTATIIKSARPSKEPPQQRRSRQATRERARPVVDGSTQLNAGQGTAEEQKLRKELQTKKRKSVAKQQNANKAAATGSVTSSSSAGKSPTKPRLSISTEKKSPIKPSTSASARTKAPIKRSSQRRDLKETTQTESPFMASKSAQHENDLLRINSDATTNPAVIAFRNCIASYFARGMERGIDGTWAELLTRATEGECRVQFDDMAQILSKRFGNKRVEQVMQQLIETTLLPAAKAAARGKSDTGVSAIPLQ
jgi:hypothetical protein